MPRVAITQDLESIERAIEAALDHLELEPLINGKLVAVKPNDTWASKEDVTGVTQGDTLRGVLRVIERFDPKHIVAQIIAAVGAFGIVGFLVARRTQEIGVRRALRARPTTVLSWTR